MPTVNEIVKIYLGEVGGSRKPATLRQYTNQLQPFLKYFDGREFSSITPLEIKAYITAVSSRAGVKLAPDTIRVRITAIEQLQKFAIENQVIPAPIFGKLEKPPGRMRDQLYEPGHIDLIKKHASPEFWLIFQALRQCGARPSELANAKFENWDKTKGLIVLRDHKTATKTGVDRKIAVGGGMLAILNKATAGRTEGPLFLSPTGIGWTVDRLSQTFAHVRKKAGIPKWCKLYLARHGFATEMCKKKDVRAAAEALGHAGLGTIMRYVKTTAEELRSNQDLIDIGGLDQDAPTREGEAPAEPRSLPMPSMDPPLEEEKRAA